MAMSPAVKAALEAARKANAAKTAAISTGLLSAEDHKAVTSGEAAHTELKQVAAQVPSQTVGDAIKAVMQVTTTGVEPVSIEAEVTIPEHLTSQHRQIIESLENLRELLVASDPDFIHLLQHTHEQLLSNPELIHILRDDQIDVVYKGMLAKSNVHIAVKQSKKRGAKRSQTGLLEDGTSVGDFL